MYRARLSTINSHSKLLYGNISAFVWIEGCYHHYNVVEKEYQAQMIKSNAMLANPSDCIFCCLLSCQEQDAFELQGVQG